MAVEARQVVAGLERRQHVVRSRLVHGTRDPGRRTRCCAREQHISPSRSIVWKVALGAPWAKLKAV